MSSSYCEFMVAWSQKPLHLLESDSLEIHERIEEVCATWLSRENSPRFWEMFSACKVGGEVSYIETVLVPSWIENLTRIAWNPGAAFLGNIFMNLRDEDMGENPALLLESMAAIAILRFGHEIEGEVKELSASGVLDAGSDHLMNVMRSRQRTSPTYDLLLRYRWDGQLRPSPEERAQSAIDSAGLNTPELPGRELADA